MVMMHFVIAVDPSATLRDSEDILPAAGTATSFFSVSQTSGAPSDGSLQLEKLRVVTRWK